MKNRLNIKFHEIALMVGGSHYPEVGGQLLQRFGEEVVKECAELSVNSQYANTKSEYYEGFNEALIYASNKIKQHFGIE